MPRRRWFRFGLRALLAFAMLVVSVLCATGVRNAWQWIQHRADEQKSARLREIIDRGIGPLPLPATADRPLQPGEKPPMEQHGWEIKITGGLNAHFKQPDGPSKPGTDWAVTLKRGPEVHRILVRSYARGDGKTSQQDEISMVLRYVADRLRQGWAPSDVKGVQDDLVLPLDDTSSK
jgi:hypothetical protein